MAEIMGKRAEALRSQRRLVTMVKRMVRVTAHRLIQSGRLSEEEMVVARKLASHPSPSEADMDALYAIDGRVNAAATQTA